MENIGDRFFQYKNPLSKQKWSYQYIENISFDRNDESELAILPQKIDRSPEWRSDRIVDRL